MNPLRYKKSVTLASKELGISEDIIDDIMSFYYKRVNKTLGSLVHHAVNIPNLGTFKIRRRKIQEKLIHYENALKMYEAEIEDEKNFTMRKYENILNIKKDIESFKRIIKMLEDEDVRKGLKKEEKLKFIENESNQNLEVKESDT